MLIFREALAGLLLGISATLIPAVRFSGEEQMDELMKSHMVFATAIVTAALLGGTMKKPLAIIMLLFLCYPIKWFVWIFVAAAVGGKGVSLLSNK